MQESLGIAHQQHEYRPQERQPQLVAGRNNGFGFGLQGINAEQIVHHAICPQGAQGKHQRNAQVESHASGCACQPGEHGNDHIAEVVIRNGITGEPGVMRRECRRAQDGVNKCQLHRLLGTQDFRVGGAHESHASKCQQEKHLHAHHQPPFLAQPMSHLSKRPATGPGAGCRQYSQRQQQSAGLVAQNAQRSQQPENVSPHQQPQAARQRIAATG